MSWDQNAFAATAPRDSLSPHFPRAGGLVFSPARHGYEPLENISAHLARRFNVRAWLGWMGDDGRVRVIARIPPEEM